MIGVLVGKARARVVFHVRENGQAYGDDDNGGLRELIADLEKDPQVVLEKRYRQQSRLQAIAEAATR